MFTKLFFAVMAVALVCEAKPLAPDNSRVNENIGVTAEQQSSSESDVEITRQIRKTIVSREDLSTYAHNVKIIAVRGVVTLKGPVRSQEEVDAIQQIATKVVGPNNVKNQMNISG